MGWEDLTEDEQEAVTAGGVPLALSPHFPFDFIRLFLGRQLDLIDLWDRWPQLQFKLLEHWCANAKHAPWTWEECSALFGRMEQRGEVILRILDQADHRIRRHLSAAVPGMRCLSSSRP